MRRPNSLINASFILATIAFPTTACIRKQRTQTALPRATIDNGQPSTCASILSDAEYRNLTARLTASSPLGVVSTNDLHGHTDARTVQLNISEQDSRSVQVGGFENLAAYLAALCRHYKGRLLFVDAGDSFQGTFISNMSQGRVILEGLSALGLSASTFGNHEFDFGSLRIQDWLAHPQRKFWYVTSSVLARENGNKIPWAELNAPRFARSVVLEVAGIRVGIAGYTTETTAVKSLPTNVADVTFHDLKKVLAEEAKPLKQQGAQLTLLLSHAGGRCDMRASAHSGDTACADLANDELGQALRTSIQAEEQWSLIVAGHTHAAQRHVIGGVPVMQTTGLGLSLAHASISFDQPQPRVTLHNPIYLCDHHFEGWAGCHPEEYAWRGKSEKSPGAAVPAKVFGVQVRSSESEKVKSILSQYRTAMASRLNEKITEIPNELLHDRLGQSSAAACLVDAWFQGLRSMDEHWGEFKASDIDVAALNAGAFRSGLMPGALTFGRLFEILPYDNTAHLVSLTPEEMLAFARTHEQSPHDYLMVSQGFTVHRSTHSQPAPHTQKISSPQINQSQRVLLAISTFSQTFIEKAGLKSRVIDTGVSIRSTIAETLQKSAKTIKSCQQPETGRMKIQ